MEGHFSAGHKFENSHATPKENDEELLGSSRSSGIHYDYRSSQDGNGSYKNQD